MNSTLIPPVTIRCNEGLVTIPCLDGKELNSTCSMWDNITAAEFLPGNVGTGAFYILTLSKPTPDYKAVHGIKAELFNALELLARCWIFSSGMEMSNTRYEVVHAPQVEDNAGEITGEILAAAGLKSVSSSAVVNIETMAQYTRPPLESAAQIAAAMRKDRVLAKLLEYHHNARTNYFRGDNLKASWFIDLYKAMEVLEGIYGGRKNTPQNLNLPRSDWGHIGNVLNNGDYRHADETGKAPQAAPADIQRLFVIALRFLTAHLKKLGMNPVPAP